MTQEEILASIESEFGHQIKDLEGQSKDLGDQLYIIEQTLKQLREDRQAKIESVCEYFRALEVVDKSEWKGK